jgi:hypothetical protein
MHQARGKRQQTAKGPHGGILLSALALSADLLDLTAPRATQARADFRGFTGSAFQKTHRADADQAACREFQEIPAVLASLLAMLAHGYSPR